MVKLRDAWVSWESWSLVLRSSVAVTDGERCEKETTHHATFAGTFVVGLHLK
jgi:hypothetical protein